MRIKLTLGAMLVALSGCMSFPETPAETRSFLSAKTIEVNRSAGAAFGTIASRARTCLNFDTRTTWSRMGVGPVATIQDSYRTTTRGRTLIIEHYNPANVGNPGWYPRVVADVTPISGGSRVAVHASFTDGAFTNAIHAWARGDTKPCPRDQF